MKAETKVRVRELIEEGIRQGITMGASISVRQGGEEVLFDAVGYADREGKKPIRRDTIFRLYSMSKPLTAAAVMILVERGMVDLAQPVSDFLPGFRKQTVEQPDGELKENQTPVTLFHLLNMTSGLTYGDMFTKSGRMTLGYIGECISNLHTDHPVTTEEFANHMGTIPLAFVPGSSWCYGLSADILGAVVEQASSMGFGEFLQKNLFGPLGMEDTGFWVPESKQPRLAKAYGSRPDGSMKLYTGDNLCVANAMDRPPAFESGGAGMVSTITDYGKFAAMLLNGGQLRGIRVLKERTVKYFTTGGLIPPQQKAFRAWAGLEGYTYSHLLRIMDHPERACVLGSRGEYGWDGWLGCYFANLPEKDMTILLMQQKQESGTIPMTRKIRNVILSDAE